MADSPVNIADFRCRGVKLQLHQEPLRRSDIASGLVLVHSESEILDQQLNRQSEVQCNIALAEVPGVVDIDRAAQRLHARTALRAPAPQRYRSNIIRFNEPKVAVMRVHQPRVVEHWADDYDVPPAA